jgi:hypothetical protein
MKLTEWDSWDAVAGPTIARFINDSMVQMGLMYEDEHMDSLQVLLEIPDKRVMIYWVGACPSNEEIRQRYEQLTGR